MADQASARPIEPITASSGWPEASRFAGRPGAARRAVRSDGTGGRGADPGEGEPVLALEERVRAHAAGGAALAGELLEARHLERGRVGARQHAVGARDGDRDDIRRPSTAPKKTTLAFGERLMPAMPPAGAPCGRTADAGKCSSWASLVTKTSSAPSGAEAAPTTASPGLRPMISRSGRDGERRGHDALHDALRGCRARAACRRRSAASASTRSVLSVMPEVVAQHARRRRAGPRRAAPTAGRRG